MFSKLEEREVCGCLHSEVESCSLLTDVAGPPRERPVAPIMWSVAIYLKGAPGAIEKWTKKQKGLGR